MSFYVTLPSNASPNVFPDNEAGHFFVKLPQTIDVNSHYEVGLVEIQMPNAFCMIREHEVWLQYHSIKEGADVNLFLFGLRQTKYQNIDLLVNAIKKLLKRDVDERKVEIIISDCNKGFKKIVVKVVASGIESTVRDWLNAYMIVPGKVTEKHIEEDEVKIVFVYCDLVEARPVGDVMVPLLRTVPIVEKKPSSVFRIYDKPHYIPLNRFSFDTVEILLCDELGQSLSFTSGTSVLTLHFRTRKHFDLE
jgi:hypothetical protein